MKRFAMATLALTLLALGSNAWAMEPGVPTFGIKGGLSVAKITGDDADMPDPVDDVGMISPDYRTGFAVGAYMIYPFTPNLAFQPEAFYVNKGAKWEGSGQTYDEDLGEYIDYDWKQTLKLDYIEVPLLLRLEPTMSGSVGPYFLVGPSVGFKASAKMKYEVTASAAGQSISMDDEEDLDEVKSIDLGAAIGAGLVVPMESVSLLFEARYTLGLTKVDDSDTESDVKNSAFAFMVGVGF